jgi:hypothetical protein
MVQANDKLVPQPKVGFSVLFFPFGSIATDWTKLLSRLNQAQCGRGPAGFSLGH